jgi:hypothetical protein
VGIVRGRLVRLRDADETKTRLGLALVGGVRRSLKLPAPLSIVVASTRLAYVTLAHERRVAQVTKK